MWGLAAAAALVLGAGGAGARSLATTTLQVQVIGAGSVTSGGGQIVCGAGGTTCFYSTTATTGSVVLTANDQGGWTFDSWSGCPSASANQCTVTLGGGDFDVSANFTKTPDPGSKTLTVTVSGDSAGGGNVSGGSMDCDEGETNCSATAPVGSTLTMVESPDSGYIFTGWGRDCAGTGQSCVVTMSDDRTVTAAFRKPQLSVTVQGNGTVTGGGITCTSGSTSGCTADEDAGDEVTLTATPASGGSFTGWSGCTSSSAAACTVSMTEDRQVTATFSGGSGGGGGGDGGGGGATTFPLTVSVTGSGSVTGGGISCGASGTNCSVTLAAGASVTLSATPAAGATFASWGGACSGATPSCTLTMSAARSVSATFSGGSSAEVGLSVVVTGHGTVTGSGISCGNGKTTCTAKESKGSTVGLTATPGPGAKFAGWSGACTGTTPTCTVSMDASKQISARFTGGTGPATVAGTALHRAGPPVVSATDVGFEVTLRFKTTVRGQARMRALRAGRVQTALAFAAAPGRVTIGPFPVARSGFYVFEVRLAGRTLRWSACLGRCGEHATSDPFSLSRGLPVVVDAGALWSLTLRFRSSQPAGVVVRVYRSGRLARELRFPISTGAVTPGALLLSPGTYRISLNATDAYGRLRTLTWYAALP